MSIDKFTVRGFGSGGSSSGWSAPRESFKAPVDRGTSFVMGGGGLRGNPHAGSRRDASSGIGEVGSIVSRDTDGQSSRDRGHIVQSAINFRGGDITTTRWERYGLLIVTLLVAILLSVFTKFFSAASSGADWVKERRSYVGQGFE